MNKKIFILSFAALIFAACGSDDNNGTPTLPPVSNATVSPNIGGPNQPNQVYIDLSTSSQTEIKRDTWDLGFASATNRVILNGSISMATKQLETTNIDEVQQPDASVSVGFSTFSSSGYVDDPTGVLEGDESGEGTAIAEISANDADNKVYLVNLGYEVGTSTPNPGSIALNGPERGWKKIRITRSGNDYVLQYADLEATTHNTVMISKNSAHNFTFFSFTTNSVVDVQPQKDKWDLNFTTVTNYTPFGAAGMVTYSFGDFVTTNIHGGTQVYKIELDEAERDAQYEAFSLSNVNETLFAASLSDQRIIGSSWRGGGGPGSSTQVYNTMFYVVKDVDGNLYKLKFLALTDDAGERGHTVFEYELLQ